MFEWLVLLFFLSLFPLMAGFVCFRAALWGMERWGVVKYLVWVVVLAAAAGTVYGLLRLSGLLLLPGDNTISFNEFDASWRDDGACFLQTSTGPLIGGAAALVLHRKKSSGGS